MNDEQIAKINDIRSLDFRNLSKEQFATTCNLILDVWELESDRKVKEVISEKIGDVLRFIIEERAKD